MATATRIPCFISPEAKEHAIALGRRSEFEQMLEHTEQAVSGLRAIKVELARDPEGVDDPRVIINAYLSGRGRDYDPTEDEWGRWLVNTFTPDVTRHFVLISAPEAPDEG